MEGSDEGFRILDAEGVDLRPVFLVDALRFYLPSAKPSDR
jgi:hypothetical protein